MWRNGSTVSVQADCTAGSFTEDLLTRVRSRGRVTSWRRHLDTTRPYLPKPFCSLRVHGVLANCLWAKENKVCCTHKSRSGHPVLTPLWHPQYYQNLNQLKVPQGDNLQRQGQSLITSQTGFLRRTRESSTHFHSLDPQVNSPFSLHEKTSGVCLPRKYAGCPSAFPNRIFRRG